MISIFAIKVPVYGAKRNNGASRSFAPAGTYGPKISNDFKLFGDEVLKQIINGDEFQGWAREQLKKQNNVFRGTYADWVNALGMRESSDDYKKHRSGSQYLGRYQIGNSALIDIGFKDNNGEWTVLAKSYDVSDADDFLYNSNAQDKAIELYVQVLNRYIKHYELDIYFGSTMNDIVVTESGIVAASHLVGIGGVKKALESGDLNSIGDSFGTKVKEYMELLGGYNLNE